MTVQLVWQDKHLQHCLVTCKSGLIVDYFSCNCLYLQLVLFVYHVNISYKFIETINLKNLVNKDIVILKKEWPYIFNLTWFDWWMHYEDWNICMTSEMDCHCCIRLLSLRVWLMMTIYPGIFFFSFVTSAFFFSFIFIIKKTTQPLLYVCLVWWWHLAYWGWPWTSVKSTLGSVYTSWNCILQTL